MTGVVALAVVAALGQILAGFVRLTPSSRESLRAIGYTAIQGSAEEVAYAATLVVTGTAIGVVVAVLASPLFPGGFARALEPDRGHIRVDGPALLVGATVMGLALLLWVAVAARLARRRRPAPRPSAVADAVSRTGLRPEANVGVRFALSRDGRDRLSSWATIATLCVAMAVVVGTLVFGSSLTRLVEDGALYGYNYRYVAGAPTGGPLDPSFIDAARTAPGVAGAMALSQASASIRGDDVDLVGVDPLRGGLLPVVLAGRFPASPDEVALGELTARSLHVHVGDDVAFDGADGGPVTYHVVGFVVLPSVSFGEGGGRGAAMIAVGPAAGVAGSRAPTARPPARVRYRTGRRRAGHRRDTVERAVTAARRRERVPCPLGAHHHRGGGRPARVRRPPPRPPLLGPGAPARRRRPARPGRRPAVDHPRRPHPSERARFDRARDRGAGRHRGRPDRLSGLRRPPRARGHSLDADRAGRDRWRSPCSCSPTCRRRCRRAGRLACKPSMLLHDQ